MGPCLGCGWGPGGTLDFSCYVILRIGPEGTNLHKKFSFIFGTISHQDALWVIQLVLVLIKQGKCLWAQCLETILNDKPGLKVTAAVLTEQQSQRPRLLFRRPLGYPSVSHRRTAATWATGLHLPASRSITTDSAHGSVAREHVGGRRRSPTFPCGGGWGKGSCGHFDWLDVRWASAAVIKM